VDKRDFIQGVHYYLEEGRVVFTTLYLSERGFCCGNGCRHCPYEPRAIKNNTILENKVARLEKES